MITKLDLDSAIAECQGKRNPDASTCIKLAAFYTIRREMFGEEKDVEPLPAYSFAPASQPTEGIDYPGESEFARAINGRDQQEIWPVIDELMDTINVLQPRLYDAVMRKLQD